MDALKYITKQIPAVAPVTNWISHKIFPQYQSLDNLYKSPIYLQAREFINGQWLIEHDLKLLGLSSRTAFDSLCCYTVSPHERLHHLTEYYYKKIEELFIAYEAVTHSSENSWLTERQRAFLQTQMSELAHMMTAYKERLEMLKEHEVPPPLVSFYQSFGTDLRILFILRLKSGPCNPVLQTLPALEDPAMRHLIGHVATITELQQCHEQPKTDPIGTTTANEPPLCFMGQENGSDKRKRGNQQLKSRWQN